MSVFRVDKTKNYTVMSNRHLQEKRMSLKAKGLLSLMLSLPDEWDYSLNGLASLCLESEACVKRVLNELKEFGYVEIIKLYPDKTKSKRIETVWNIYEIPKTAGQTTGQKQRVENVPQLNTKEENTNNKVLNCQFATDVISYLNEKTSANYKASTPSTLKLINARANEGFTLDDFKAVIDNKVDDWLNDPNMSKYLRPATLFQASKFESYLNERKTKKVKAIDYSIYD